VNLHIKDKSINQVDTISLTPTLFIVNRLKVAFCYILIQIYISFFLTFLSNLPKQLRSWQGTS
jgi:hypothetical protein